MTGLLRSLGSRPVRLGGGRRRHQTSKREHQVMVYLAVLQDFFSKCRTAWQSSAARSTLTRHLVAIFAGGTS
jgi:hypothetical protein